MEGLHFFGGEVGVGVLTKGYIELALVIVAAQSVVAMAVKVQKQGCLQAGIVGGVKDLAELVVAFRIVGFRYKKTAAIVNELIPVRFQVLIQINQVKVDVAEDGFGE